MNRPFVITYDTMRYGETMNATSVEESEVPDGEIPGFIAQGLTLGLYRVEASPGEIFPPSEGDVRVFGTRVLCQKRKVERVHAPIAMPAGPGVVMDMVVHRDPGLQWFIFDIDEVDKTGRTMLLRYKLVVEDLKGKYEVLLGTGPRSSRLVKYIERKLGDV